MRGLKWSSEVMVALMKSFCDKGLKKEMEKKGIASNISYLLSSSQEPPSKTVSAALSRVLRLTAGHKYCSLGRLSSEVGWNHYETIKDLEKKRKEKPRLCTKGRSSFTKCEPRSRRLQRKNLALNLKSLLQLLTLFCKKRKVSS